MELRSRASIFGKGFHKAWSPIKSWGLHNHGWLLKLPRVLAVVIGTAVLVAALGCSTTAPVAVEPTPNIDATVEARAKELVAAQPTSTPYPTYTPVPTATPPT